MTYLLRGADPEITCYCKETREVSFMLLFCCPKLYKGSYYGQKEMAFPCREALNVCMPHIGIPVSNQSQEALMPRGGTDYEKQEVLTHYTYKSRSAA